MSMLEAADIKDKLDMENNKGEAAVTLFEDCQSDQLTPDIVVNKSGKDEERASLSSPLSNMVGFSTAAGRKIEVSEKVLAEARMKLKDTENKTDDKSAVVPSTISFIGGFMTTAVTKIDVSENALAAPMWKMADVGKKTDLVDSQQS